MNSLCWRDWHRKATFASLLFIVVLQLFPLMSSAQNLGSQPATGQAVQGQTAAQPEGAVLNLVNWVGNVIAPVGAIVVLSATRSRDGSEPMSRERAR